MGAPMVGKEAGKTGPAGQKRRCKVCGVLGHYGKEDGSGCAKAAAKALTQAASATKAKVAARAPAVPQQTVPVAPFPFSQQAQSGVRVPPPV